MTDTVFSRRAAPDQSARGRTPADLSITPRDRRFGRHRPAPQDRWWANGDPVATAFFNALSVTFPKGEAYFVEAVKAHRDCADPRLAEEIRAFTMQEVMHSREHLAFNRQVVDAGYDVSRLEAKVDYALGLGNGRPPIARLGVTMALEHFTAIFAHLLLADPRFLAGADPETAALWRWHALEEIEHKGVAYDTWLAATRGWGRGRRWRVKALLMLIVTKNFIHHRALGNLDLLAQDGMTGWRAWRGMLAYAFVRPGFLRQVFLPWCAYFLPGFHPWNTDDRALIAAEEDSPYAAARPGAN